MSAKTKPPGNATRNEEHRRTVGITQWIAGRVAEKIQAGEQLGPDEVRLIVQILLRVHDAPPKLVGKMFGLDTRGNWGRRSLVESMYAYALGKTENAIADDLDIPPSTAHEVKDRGRDLFIHWKAKHNAKKRKPVDPDQ